MEKRINATMLIELIELTDRNARRYSGRFMYGAECVGVTLKAGEDLAFGAELADAAAEELGQDLDQCLEVINEVSIVMGEARVDDMGRGVIVYFPAFAWPTENEDPREDNDKEGE